MKRALFAAATCLLFAFVPCPSPAQEAPKEPVQILSDIAYKAGENLTPYETERCKLDLYLPQGINGYPTLVWFHGGGLTGGNKAGVKALGESLARAGIAVAAVNYRLSPKASYPAYIQDAAAAVAWTKAHIAEHGGSPERLFIGGHSAGGYLTLMLGMDPHYLADLGVQPSAIAGLIPISGQTMTHYTIREERGIGMYTITADEAAPVHFIRKDTPPFLVLYADHDMVGRAEENAYFVAMMKGCGNKAITGKLMTDRNHGSIAGKIVEEGDPARAEILKFIAPTTEKPQ